MKLGVHRSADVANVAATDCLGGWLSAPTSRTVMVAGGNTPIELYRRTVSSQEADALASVQEHERKITQAGGLDVIILGLGQNGHLGFNEPGSAEDSREIVSAPKFITIGIDVGGTKIAAGLIAFPEGRVLAQRLTPTAASRGGRSVLEDALRLARELASATDRVDAIGLGVCELVDRDGKVASSNCIHWQDQPVREELGTIAPAVIEADVRAAALAESLFGAAKPFRTFLYVTVGTGISCCLMLDGRPFLGARGATGTMGSSPLSIPCEHCGQVSQRTLEDIAAGPALVTRFNALHGPATSGHEVLAAATAGHSVAAKIVQSASEALGSQVALIVNVLDPEAVVIGGGLGLSDGPYWDHFIAATRRHIWSELHRDLPILRAATGVDAGWIGAAARAWREFPNASNQS